MVKLKKSTPKEIRTWEPHEIDLLREAADRLGGFYRLVLELGLATGARRKLFALRWDDFHPTEPAVRIVRQLETLHRTKTVALKSKSSRRSVLVLEEWGPFHQPGARGLILDDGHSGQQKSEAFVKIRTEAGFEDEVGVGFHSLRHTYARRYLEDFGGSLEELQGLLGHEKYQTTEEYYKHFSEDVILRMAKARVYRNGAENWHHAARSAQLKAV